MILTYLAVVEKRKTLQNPGKLHLYAMRGMNGVWVRHKESVAMPVDKGFGEGVMVLVELNDKRHILKIVAGIEEVAHLLVSLSSEIREQKAENKAILLSVDFQVIELEKRRQELDRREDLIRLSEEKIKEFKKTTGH